MLIKKNKIEKRDLNWTDEKESKKGRFHFFTVEFQMEASSVDVIEGCVLTESHILCHYFTNSPCFYMKTYPFFNPLCILLTRILFQAKRTNFSLSNFSRPLHFTFPAPPYFSSEVIPSLLFRFTYVVLYFLSAHFGSIVLSLNCFLDFIQFRFGSVTGFWHSALLILFVEFDRMLQLSCKSTFLCVCFRLLQLQIC